MNRTLLDKMFLPCLSLPPRAHKDELPWKFVRVRGKDETGLESRRAGKAQPQCLG